MPSPNTDPNKKNSGDDDHHRSGLHIFGIPCAEDARSVPQTRSGRCASPIVHLGRRRVPGGAHEMLSSLSIVARGIPNNDETFFCTSMISSPLARGCVSWPFSCFSLRTSSKRGSCLGLGPRRWGARPRSCCWRQWVRCEE